MLPTFLITVLFIAICVLLLAIKLLVKKGGTFPNLHLEGNKALRDRGIRCIRTQDREAARQKNLFELSK